MSLLAESDEDSDNQVTPSVIGRSQNSKTKNEDDESPSKKQKLTVLQDEILYSVQSINLAYFVDLGGLTYLDINFEDKRSGIFPLGLAAAKGNSHFVKLMLENKMLDIEKKNPDGTNSFWIAARFGKGDVMKVLAEHGIDVLV